MRARGSKTKAATLFTSKPFELRLYPASWFYNAGVLGFLQLLQALGQDPRQYFQSDGTILLPIDPQRRWIAGMHYSRLRRAWFIMLLQLQRGYTEELAKRNYANWIRNKKLFYKKDGSTSGKLFTNQDYYPNLSIKALDGRIEAFFTETHGGVHCTFCHRSADKGEEYYQNFGKLLAASGSTFPNAYWDNEPKDFVCPACVFLLMCHHLALIKLPNRTHLFINAPSFALMYQLNLYAHQVYQSRPDARELLATSLLRYSMGLTRQLASWHLMNIEIVLASSSGVDYFVLPYETALLLSEPKIASLLDQIEHGYPELGILNYLLDRKYNKILERGEELLRKTVSGGTSRDRSFADKVFYLYSLIQDLKTSIAYG